MNYFIVCRMLGIIVFFFSLSMLTMVPFALWFQEYDALLAMSESLGIGLFISMALYLVGRMNRGADLFRRESLAVVGLSWLLVALAGSLPLYLGGMVASFTDAYFETMSGLTTTGATILTDIEAQSRTLLYWRSFLHFVGGLGIVVFFVAILPVLGVGGKSLFRQEVPGPVPEGLTPRIKDTAIILCQIYIGFNIAEFVALKFAGMGYYDAINHALSTMATGGFSTKTASIGAYSALVQWIVIFFMFMAGTNFSLHQRFFRGDFWVYFRSAEFRTYLTVIVSVAVVFTGILYFTGNSAVSNEGQFNFRDSLFTTLAIQTTTGFGTVDFDQWPAGCRIILVILMFIGGMAGSTAGGMKVIRFIILIKSGLHLLRQEVMPRRVSTLKVDRRVLDPAIQKETFGFFFIYIMIFILSATIVTFLMPGQDLISSVSAVVACLNNIGPGLAAVGPTMDYADQGSIVKWLLSLLMAMGRLELYAILVLFSPRFWVPR